LALTLVPISAAQDNDANDTYDRPAECGEQEFHEQESSAEVHDVIDNPCDYLNREVIVQSEVDRVLSDRSFVLETDNQVFGEDHLLVISGSPDCTVYNLDDEAEVPIGSLDEGDEAQASGVVRMFNRSELERNYGTLDLGADLDRYGFTRKKKWLSLLRSPSRRPSKSLSRRPCPSPNCRGPQPDCPFLDCSECCRWR
jgi:hypothetical protein